MVNVQAHTPVSRHHWWATLLRGIAALIFGILALAWPGITLVVLVALFGAYALIDGIVAVFLALQETRTHHYWWVMLLEGLVGIAIGIITFFWPAITALILLYLIAIWAFVTGVFELGTAFSGRIPAAQEWALAIAGILSIILGILLVIEPGAGLLTIVFLVAIYAIIWGILLIVRAFQYRRLRTV
jgi:uncharacterized membrane protein HdeD (DUF308 family)